MKVFCLKLLYRGPAYLGVKYLVWSLGSLSLGQTVVMVMVMVMVMIMIMVMVMVMVTCHSWPGRAPATAAA